MLKQKAVNLLTINKVYTVFMLRAFILGFIFLTISGCTCNRPAKLVSDSSASLTSYQAEHITHIETGTTTPNELVYFACSLSETPYKYGSVDPKEGFDCSGFVTYVFNHFNIMVPRTSVDFTPVEHPIELKNATLGDLILFTGTDSTIRVVGHMGIISSGPTEPLKFIHSTSGKAKGVVETPLNAYYQGRYVKTIRIFKQNDR